MTPTTCEASGRRLGVGAVYVRQSDEGHDSFGADFLEIRAEDIGLHGAGDDGVRFSVGGRAISAPVIVRGAQLSLGTVGPVNRDALDHVKNINDATECVYYGEPLCMSRVPGLDLGHLAPIWFTPDVLASTIDRVDAVQQALGKPLLLESLTYMPPRCAKPQADFLSGLVDSTGCRLTVNVTAVHAAARAHGFDAADYLDGLPMGAIALLRIAPGRAGAEVWASARRIAGAAQLEGVILDIITQPADIGRRHAQAERARSLLAPDTGTRHDTSRHDGFRQVAVHV